MKILPNKGYKIEIAIIDNSREKLRDEEVFIDTLKRNINTTFQQEYYYRRIDTLIQIVDISGVSIPEHKITVKLIPSTLQKYLKIKWIKL